MYTCNLVIMANIDVLAKYYNSKIINVGGKVS